MPSIITVAQAKEQLNILADDVRYDGELAGYVDAASGLVEDYRHEVIAQREVTEYQEVARQVPQIVLRTVPILSLLEIARVDGSVTWDVATLRVEDPVTGRVTGAWFGGSLRIRVLAGYATIPPNIVLATQIVLQSLWESQQRPTVGPQPIGAGGNELLLPGVPVGIPPQAAALLGGRPPAFA
jgi:hypothetical protein